MSKLNPIRIKKDQYKAEIYCECGNVFVVKRGDEIVSKEVREYRDQKFRNTFTRCTKCGKKIRIRHIFVGEVKEWVKRSK